MPIPINPSNSESKYQFDISFLIPKEDNKKVVTASDKEATLLMKIWASGKRIGEYKFSLSDSVISQREFVTLKSSGLLTGDMANCELTNRAKKVITVMSLGENNSFLKKRVEKSYSEILASANKRTKTGYRIPKTADGRQIKQCKIKAGNSTATLTYEEWITMGEKMGWDK